MRRIILDTNFLMVPAMFKVDIFSEIDRICSFDHELVVIRESISELTDIARSKDQAGAAAKLALDLIRSKGIKIAENPSKTKTLKNADQLIIELAESGDYIVATQDRGLKSILKARGVQLILLRQKSHLELAMPAR